MCVQRQEHYHFKINANNILLLPLATLETIDMFEEVTFCLRGRNFNFNVNNVLLRLLATLDTIDIPEEVIFCLNKDVGQMGWRLQNIYNLLLKLRELYFSQQLYSVNTSLFSSKMQYLELLYHSHMCTVPIIRFFVTINN